MKKHTLFLALLVFGVHGLHIVAGVEPSIGTRHIDLRLSWLVVIYSGGVIADIAYRYYKKHKKGS